MIPLIVPRLYSRSILNALFTSEKDDALFFSFSLSFFGPRVRKKKNENVASKERVAEGKKGKKKIIKLILQHSMKLIDYVLGGGRCYLRCRCGGNKV